uniref:Reverse transcriptase zinc-binding domain-containing protein n=1 Tax=Quercus lobata TaxID=97700 RepID=A0A7N2N0P5_QUELO
MKLVTLMKLVALRFVHRKIHWKKWEILCQPKSKGGLGFRELGKFNEVMLGKQVWRLVHDTDSLFFRVFKAKYFPTGTIFDAKTGRVLSPVSILSEEAIVDQLIDRDSRWWNSALVDSIFFPSEAQLIKYIPVCLSAQRDFLLWPHSRTDGRRKFWNSLWKLNVPNKGQFVRELLELVVCSSLNSEVFAMVCWALWNRRNKMRVGEVVWPLTQVVGIARHHLQEFQQVRRYPSKKIRAQRPRWKPPDTGWVKANFDGAIF